MASSTSRLRKTFRYPTEDNDSEPEAMDEEEQENLIKHLTSQNISLNTQYTRILLTLPLVCILPYLVTSPSLLSLLSVSSLLATAYLVYTLPSGETGLSILDKLNGLETGKGEGPVRRFLPGMNLVLVGILAVLGGLKGQWWVFGQLPAGVYGIVVCGKWVMGGVDPGRELEGLKYGFKGA